VALREVVIPYEPRPLQLSLHRALDERRWAVAVCHRRFGKTVCAVNQLIRRAVTCTKPRPRLAYVGPTYRQAKQNAWDYLLHYTSTVPGRAANTSELRVDFGHNSSQIRLYGADNPDSLRGIYLDGVVLDEYGLMPPNVWGEVLRPALADRQGWALFIGTPAGRNQFYTLIHGDNAEWPGAQTHPDWSFASYPASMTGYVADSELRAARQDMTDDEYRQEFECSFTAAVKGAIFAKELEAAREAGRIGTVPYDSALPVDTDWDLGIGDATAIWFSQSTRSGEVRLIDYYEASGEGFQHYAEVLNKRGYVYGTHWAPHDIAVREIGAEGRSRRESARAFGLNFELTPRLHTKPGLEVEEGINAARLILSRCWFDETKCKAGLEALKHYRRDYNERLGEFKAAPVHDWSSHASDAFRGMSVRHRIPQIEKKRRVPPIPRKYAWT